MVTGDSYSQGAMLNWADSIHTMEIAGAEYGVVSSTDSIVAISVVYGNQRRNGVGVDAERGGTMKSAAMLWQTAPAWAHLPP